MTHATSFAVIFHHDTCVYFRYWCHSSDYFVVMCVGMSKVTVW